MTRVLTPSLDAPLVEISILSSAQEGSVGGPSGAGAGDDDGRTRAEALKKFVGRTVRVRGRVSDIGPTDLLDACVPCGASPPGWDFFLQLVVVDGAPAAEPCAISVVVTGAGAQAFLPSLTPCDLRTHTDAARALARKLAALQGKAVELAVQGAEVAGSLALKLVATEALG